jgi:hypothetical protein
MAIYSTISGKIEEILEKVKTAGKLAEIHSNPTSKFKAYPVAVFFPTSVENEFETNRENIKVYNFRLYLIAMASQSSINKLYNTVMPNLVDDVLEEFDSSWDLDSIDGHRVWIRLESGNWETSVEQQNLIVYSEFNLQIKVLTNN